MRKVLSPFIHSVVSNDSVSLLEDSEGPDQIAHLHSLIWAFVVHTCIIKTCLYNFVPLKPHFYTVKLGFTGVYIIFLIFAQKQIVGTG